FIIYKLTYGNNIGIIVYTRKNNERGDYMRVRHDKCCKRLKSILFEKSITYETLAQELGISENNIHFKINGRRRWWVDECISVAKILGYDDVSEVFPEIYKKMSNIKETKRL